MIGTSVADKTADMDLTGTFSIGLEVGTSADISIASSMSLEDIVDAINAKAETYQCQACIIEIEKE